MKAVLLVAALSLAACSTTGTSTVPGTDGSSASGAGRSSLQLLGGAPSGKLDVALYDAPIAGMNGVKVNMGIDGYQLVTTLGTAVPFIANPKPQVVNLLDLHDHAQNSEGNAPIGTYSAVRMLIDSASSFVQIGGFKIPILWGTPGHATTSPVVAVDFPATFAVTGIGEKPTVSLDFNAFESVKFYNNAIYVQPKVSAAYAAAQLKGRIRNAAGKNVSGATIIALDALGHAVNTTFSATDGTFWMHALPPGIYTLVVKNSYTTATGDTLTASGADADAAPSMTAVLSPNDNLDLHDITD